MFWHLQLWQKFCIVLREALSVLWIWNFFLPLLDPIYHFIKHQRNKMRFIQLATFWCNNGIDCGCGLKQRLFFSKEWIERKIWHSSFHFRGIICFGILFSKQSCRKTNLEINFSIDIFISTKVFELFHTVHYIQFFPCLVNET